MTDAPDTPLFDADTAAEVTRRRALGDVRRGLPVVLTGDGRAMAALAAENAEASMLGALEALSGTRPALVVTSRRAATLTIDPHGGRFAAIALPAHLSDEEIRALADPSLDLAYPLRGPFTPATLAAPELAEAALALCRTAELLPAVLVAEGAPETMIAAARSEGLTVIRQNPAAGTASATAGGLTMVARAKLPLEGAEDARIVAFRPDDGGREHIAIVIGEPPKDAPVLVRIHSECFTGDFLASLKCDCGDQLRSAVRILGETGGGILLYLAQEGRGIGLVAKLKAYALQDQGFDTVDANLRLGFETDERDFGPAAAMLQALGYSKVRLMTNNPDKVAALAACGIEIAERVPHRMADNPHNVAYLKTKRERTGHFT